MKTTLLVLGLVGVMALAVAFGYPRETLKYVKSEVEVIREVEAPKEDWMLDEEAIQAAKDVIRKKELTAELERIDGEVKALQDRRKEVAKELDGY